MALLVVLFIVVPLAELYVIVQVGQLIGIWPTLALLLADAVLGSLLLRHQGREAWQRFNAALAARRFPGKEVADGALIVVGGTLLVAPGFLTDIAGLLLLLPPTRALARRAFRGYFSRRFLVIGGFPGGGPGRGPAGPGSAPPPGGRRDYDFEASAEEVPPDPERRLD